MWSSVLTEGKIMEKPRLIIFASGTKDGGGSGFENLVRANDAGVLDANIVGVVSNHEHGGVREKADRLGVRFVDFQKPRQGGGQAWSAEEYQRIVREAGAEWVALSGWLKLVEGLDSAHTFNIHPALLSQLGGRFGGPGMYGHHVHEAVKVALDSGELSESGLSMHFVTDEYDRGPVFFEHKVPLQRGMTADEIGAAVNKAEHEWQPKITNLVIHGKISWDGKNSNTLKPFVH
jgi:phosphoribosylglycinamide formyltransferase-1